MAEPLRYILGDDSTIPEDQVVDEGGDPVEEDEDDDDENENPE